MNYVAWIVGSVWLLVSLLLVVYTVQDYIECPYMVTSLPAELAFDLVWPLWALTLLVIWLWARVTWRQR